MRPFGGMIRQKRHSGGRCRSTSFGAPKPYTVTNFGSSQPSSSLTTSLRPAPGMPVTITATARAVDLRSSNCASSSRS